MRSRSHFNLAMSSAIAVKEAQENGNLAIALKPELAIAINRS